MNETPTEEQSERLRRALAMRRWDPIVVPGFCAVAMTTLAVCEWDHFTWPPDFGSQAIVAGTVAVAIGGPWMWVAFRWGVIDERVRADREREQLREADRRAEEADRRAESK